MSVFRDIQIRRKNLISKGFNPSSLVLVTNERTIYHILRDAGQDGKALKESTKTKEFYGMSVIIIKTDNFDHNKDLHFEIFEQLNK